MTPETSPLPSEIVESRSLRTIHALWLQQKILGESLDTWEKVTASIGSFVAYAKAVVNGITTGSIRQEDLWEGDTAVEVISDHVWRKVQDALELSWSKLFAVSPGDKKYNNWRLTPKEDGSSRIDLVEIKAGVIFTASFDVPTDIPVENVRSAFEADKPLQDIWEPGFWGGKDEPGATFLFRRKLVVNDNEGKPRTLLVHIGNHTNPTHPDGKYVEGGAFSITDELRAPLDEAEDEKPGS